MASMQRRLAAIVHADLADFTRLMEGSEILTVHHLKSVTSDIWRPSIEAGSGRLVGIVGDALLAEFTSTVAAVAAAIDIQERMARFNRTLEVSERLMFRIGVHLGEVIVDEDQTSLATG
jgi:class 3 adenylate cyclase